jgi:hypothetical protein
MDSGFSGKSSGDFKIAPARLTAIDLFVVFAQLGS